MGIDLSRYKVIYGDRALHAIALEGCRYKDAEWPGMQGKTIVKPVELTVLCLNEDGNIVALTDEAWRFQFVPILQKEG